MDTLDLDLYSRASWGLQADSQVSVHATQMATIIGGEGLTSIKGRGVAHQVKLFSSSFRPPAPDPTGAYLSQGISIQNHSYGTEMEAFYGGLAEAFDQNSVQIPHLLHVFSAGNMGLKSDTLGKYAGLQGFATLTGNFKQAKNVLVVGAVDTIERVLAFSSGGPTYDGRIKPELCAYSLEGTSNAAALVSGTAVLLQQGFRLLYDSLPSSALLKALLINGAKDLGNRGPDYHSGFGKAQPLKSMRMIEEEKFLSGHIASGEIQSFEISLPNHVSNFRMTLCWTDPPAKAGAATSLVHDLDLSLVNPQEKRIRPWVLLQKATVEALASPALRGRDSLNNVEQIEIKDAKPGKYHIEVSGNRVGMDGQTFFLAYDWEELEDFEWTYPSQGDFLPYDGKDYSYLRWKTNKTGMGSLYVSGKEEGSWELVQAYIPLEKQFFKWRVPDEIRWARLLFEMAEDSFESTPFLIGRPIFPNLSYLCEDRMRIEWEADEGIDSYTLYKVNQGGLQPWLEGKESYFEIEKEDFPASLLALGYELKDQGGGLRSPAFDYRFQGGSCYLNSYFAYPYEDFGLGIRLNLGSLEGLERIFVNKIEKGEKRELYRLRPQGLEIELVDSFPRAGLNTYNIEVERSNGERVVSEAFQEYYIGPSSFLVFPNPLREDKSLNVYAQRVPEEPHYLELIDINGKQVGEWEIFSERQGIDLSHLQSGIYYYSIRHSGRAEGGKLIIN